MISIPYTKQAVINGGYTINEYGIVQDPGKFEGSHWAAIVFYELMLDGRMDEILWDDSESVDVFFIHSEHDAYELSSDTYAITLYVSEQGFVYFSEWTQSAYEALVARFEALEIETDERSQ